MTIPWDIVILGGIGGLLPDFLRVVRLVTAGDASKLAFVRTPLFWIGLVLLVVVGAATAWLFNNTVQPLVTLTALSTGFSGPEVLTRLVSTPPSGGPGPGGGGESPSIRVWWGN